MEGILNKNSDVRMLVIGDININMLRLSGNHPNSITCRYQNLFSSFDFCEINNQVLRPASGSIIDKSADYDGITARL